MRAVVCPAMVLAGVLAGCSPLLGIEDPKAGGDDAGVIDAAAVDAALVDAIDAPAGDYLTLSVGDFRLARQQIVRLRVQRMRAGGGMDDVTDQATYRADNGAVTFGAKGAIIGAVAGSSTITVSFTGAISATVKATVSTFTCHPVINEFTTGTTAAGADDEFVEIYNPCANAIDVTGWTLNYRASTTTGTTDTRRLITLADPMASGELRVYAGSAFTGTSLEQWPVNTGMAQTNGALGLRSSAVDLPLVDSVAYGTISAGHPFVETKPMAVMANNMSGSRLPFDGKDDDVDGTVDGDNSADFRVVGTPTPGALNAP